jgi:hypothetical protein
MRLIELELFKEKPKVKKEKIYRKEITWTMDQVINSSYSGLYFRNIKATN